MFYVLLLTYIFILSLLRKKIKEKSVVDIFIMLSMTIVYGIRYDVGIDYFSYERQFYDTIGFYGQREFLYDLLMKLFRLFDIPFWFFNIFLGFIIFYLLYRTGKDLKIEYNRVIIFFILTGMLFVSFNLVRQTLAAVIILYGFRYIIRGNIIKYFICVFVAFLFHSSAIIFLPFYYIKYFKITPKRLLFLLTLGMALYFTNAFDRIAVYIVPSQYGHFLDGRYDYQVSIGFGVIFFIALAIYTSFNSVNHKQIYYPYYALYMLGYSVFIFTLNSFIMTRLNVYSQFSLVFVLTLLLNVTHKKNELKVLSNITVVIALLVLFISQLFNMYNLDTNNLMYKTILTS